MIVFHSRSEGLRAEKEVVTLPNFGRGHRPRKARRLWALPLALATATSKDLTPRVDVRLVRRAA